MHPEKLTFGEALEAMETGRAVTRPSKQVAYYLDDGILCVRTLLGNTCRVEGMANYDILAKDWEILGYILTDKKGKNE